jgi:hypothetical protein
MLQHRYDYEDKVRLSIVCELDSVLRSLEREICAGKAPEDFKARVDAVYNEAACEHDCVWQYMSDTNVLLYSIC